VQALSAFINTLDTGDLILTKIDDALGRFLQFSLDAPWNHVAVVVRRKPLAGVANEKTEALLQKFPFRRATHKFCSPGYCRCFDHEVGDFPPSFCPGVGQVALLESTGEGIHLYDLAHRLFLAPAPFCALAVRRLRDAPNRSDHERVGGFLKEVRGSLYSTVKDELRVSISYHHGAADDNKVSEFKAQHESHVPEEMRSYFCSKVVAEFYQHMGWMDGALRSSASVMPPDFVSHGSVNPLARPVELVPGAATFEVPEVVWSSELGVALPLKRPKK